VGEQERMDGTVIGDSVNLASRLESLTKTDGAHIIVSEATFRLLPNCARFNSRFIDKVIVKGKTEPVPIIEILDGKSDAVTQFKLDHRQKFEAAAHAFHEGEYDAALSAFQSLQQLNALDASVNLCIKRCIARTAGKKVYGVDEGYKKKA
jgi:hypothetical protein